MKKKSLILYCITVMLFCQYSTGASAISEVQKTAISEHCETIHDDLKNLQKVDSRARVYLGGYFEKILSKFMTPLNIRLLENHLSSAELVQNQNRFAEAKQNFVNDFIVYQQNLEELIQINCKMEPESFYATLGNVREKRSLVRQDVSRLKKLLAEHLELVKTMKATLR